MKHLILALSLFCIIPESKGDGVAEEITVTGSRITRSDYFGVPAVSIKKNADFLIQNIRLINDSRSPELRRKEIIATIDNLLKAARKAEGIELSYGEGFLIPVKLNDDSLQLIEDRKRADTSYVDIVVKVAYDGSRSPKQQIVKLRDFIADAELDSRTEVESIGDIGLSIIGPEQFRYEILKKIAVENQKIKEVIGGSCEMTISGLEGLIEWERTGIAELTLYISYETEVSCS